MEVAADSRIWKYMDMAKFISMMDKRALYFSCPSQFTDPFEGHLPKSHVEAHSQIVQDYIDQLYEMKAQFLAHVPTAPVGALDGNIATAKERFEREFDAVRLKFGVSCWHKSDFQSDAMWKLYTASGHGIAIQSTVGRLRAALANTASLVIADVRYADFDNDPIEIGHEHYALFMKRQDFAHERELRSTILLDQPGTGQSVCCDLDELIEALYVSPLAEPYYREAVEAVARGRLMPLAAPLTQSDLYRARPGGLQLALRPPGASV